MKLFHQQDNKFKKKIFHGVYRWLHLINSPKGYYPLFENYIFQIMNFEHFLKNEVEMLTLFDNHFVGILSSLNLNILPKIPVGEIRRGL